MNDTKLKRRSRELLHLVGPTTSYQPCQQTLKVLKELHGRIDLGDLDAFFGPSYEPHKIALRMQREDATDLGAMVTLGQLDHETGAWVVPGVAEDADARLFVPFEVEGYSVLVEVTLTEQSARKRCWRLEDDELGPAIRFAKHSGDDAVFVTAADMGDLEDLLPPWRDLLAAPRSREHDELVNAAQLLLGDPTAAAEPEGTGRVTIEGFDWWAVDVNGVTIWNLPSASAAALRRASELIEED